jgi:hypothetical protein
MAQFDDERRITSGTDAERFIFQSIARHPVQPSAPNEQLRKLVLRSQKHEQSTDALKAPPVHWD